MSAAGLHAAGGFRQADTLNAVHTEYTSKHCRSVQRKIPANIRRYLPQVCMQLVGFVKPGAFAISLTKGMRVLDSGPQLISQMVTTLTGMPCRQAGERLHRGHVVGERGRRFFAW